jgi:hypothetical protein
MKQILTRLLFDGMLLFSTVLPTRATFQAAESIDTATICG